jgi:hypothetical protein
LKSLRVEGAEMKEKTELEMVRTGRRENARRALLKTSLEMSETCAPSGALRILNLAESGSRLIGVDRRGEVRDSVRRGGHSFAFANSALHPIIRVTWRQ